MGGSYGLDTEINLYYRNRIEKKLNEISLRIQNRKNPKKYQSQLREFDLRQKKMLQNNTRILLF